MIQKLRIISLGTLLSLSVVIMSNTTFAQSTNNSKEQQDITYISYDLNIPIDSNNSQGTFIPTYKYAKAFYQNDADAKATVYIQSIDGYTTYDSFSVDANSSKRSDKTMFLSAGTEYSCNVVILGGTVSPKGTLIIKTASTSDGLDNSFKGQQDITNRIDINPFKISYDLNIPIDSNNSQGTFIPTYKYVKAFYQNDADAKATVYIQSSGGSKTYDSFSVDANSSKYSDSTIILSAGTEYSCNVVILGGTVSPKGTLIIKSASTFDGLDNSFKGQQDITHRIDIRPFAGNYDFNESIDSSNSQGTFIPTYKYVKVFYQNDTDAKATVQIQTVDGNKTYDSFSVDANSFKRSNKTMILSTDTKYLYVVTISGGTVSPKGTLIIKSSSTKGELD